MPDRSDVPTCAAGCEARDDLVERLGFPGDVDVDRGRWQLYRQALESEDHHPPLLAALRHEPDPQPALAVAYLAISALPAESHGEWISFLPESVRHKAQERSVEVTLLRRAVAGRLTRDEIDPHRWMDWLQRRMAAEATDRAVVDQLADNGRTKRVRAAATQRSRSFAARVREASREQAKDEGRAPNP